MLAGLLIALAAAWTWYAMNRLWQQGLSESAGEALDAAAGLGLELLPPGLRARRVARGRVSDREVRLEWRGGLTGEHCVLRLGSEARRLPLIRDAGALREALGLADPAAQASGVS